MQIHHMGYGIKGFYKLAKLGQFWDMIPEEAQHRLRVLRFWKKYGLEATREAFGVSRRTLYRWQAKLRAARGDPTALIPQKPIPRRRRQSHWPKEVIDHIRYLREKYPNLGKARIYVLLKPWCEQRGLRCPSISTIGRIIARAPDKMRHVPVRLDARGKPKPLRRSEKLRKPRGFKASALEFWAVDLVERVRDGIRRYILTMVDPVSRMAFAVAVPGKRAKYTAKVLKALVEGNPEVRGLLSDNGSEFEGEFDELLKEREIRHYWTYPKSPKMNAHNERFNRTLQEQFVDYQEDLLFTDLEEFNRRLAGWLMDYNTVLPHHSLGLKPPVRWLLENHPECQRLWTNTLP